MLPNKLLLHIKPAPVIKMLSLTDTTFDNCIKCTVCTTRCPVAEARPDYPGSKQAGPDGERFRIKSPGLYDDALKYCTNCKRCEVACPSNVHIGTIIQKAKARHDGFKQGPREFMLSHTDLMGTLSSTTAPIVNVVTAMKPVKKLLDKTLGVDERRTLPKYTFQTFRKWFGKHAGNQERFDRKITYFHGCYTNYNEPAVGKDLVAVLNAINIGVRLTAKEKCCGVPLIANGFLKKARKNADLNMTQFAKSLDAGSEAVISSSSSCAMTLRDEYPDMLDVDNSAIKDQIQFVSRFLIKEFASGNKPEMKPLNLKVAYHSPCHLIRMGGVVHTVELMREIPGLELTLLDQNCCGLSGTYGFKKENYDTSQKIANKMLEQIKTTEADYIITDCESCKMQVEMNTDHKVLHPVTLIAMALV